MNATKVEAEVKRVAGNGSAIECFRTTDPDTGIVLVWRSAPNQPWVTWLWWTTYTDGTPVEQGAALASGHYFDTREAAEVDFAKRR